MKRKIFMLMFCTLPIFGYGQKKVQFTYNSSGHMTLRQEVTLRSVAYIAEEEEKPVSEIFNERLIRIYPNPTKGHLKVEILGDIDGLKGDIAIFDMKGRKIATSKVTSSETIFDLSSNATGTYVMKISLDGETTSWKIIKE